MNPKHSYRLNIWLLLIAFAATVSIVFLTSYIQAGFDISVGDVSPQSFFATHQVENRVATERLRDTARANADFVNSRNTDTEEYIYANITNLFTTLDVLRERYLTGTLSSPSIISYLPPAYISSYITPDIPIIEHFMPIAEPTTGTHADDISPSEYTIEEESSSVVQPPQMAQSVIDLSRGLSRLSPYHLDLLVQSDENVLLQFKTSIFDILSTLMYDGIREENPHSWQNDIYTQFSIRGVPYAFHSIDYIILDEYLMPNIMINEEATAELADEAASAVTPVIFLQNQNIINEGEIVTEEIYQVLVDLNFISTTYTINFIPLIGSIIIILTIFSIASTYIYLFLPKMHKNQKHIFLLFTLYLLVISISPLLASVHYIFVPILIFTMLVGMLLSYKLALIFNTGITILLLLVVNGDLNFVLYFLMTGTIIAIITRYALERSKLIILSLLMGVLSAIIAFSINLMLDRTFGRYSIMLMIYGGGSAFFSVILALGTLPIWESFFGVITPIKLLDLTNPSNEILRKLSVEAPGTYHHSIIVSNLSEAAAYDIGADVVVARVGAFFHDIGKLRHPGFFVENQVGKNLHDEIYHLASAEIIKDHVTYGLEMAIEKRLPLVLQEIISQHHGTTFIKFFYDKALRESEETGHQVNPDNYRYDGPIPQFKESAIVMLADTCEAAVRSMVSNLKTKEEIEQFVHKLIEGKLLEGQLIESGLTIKDLDLIEKAFMRVFNGMYHQRVKYPKDMIQKEAIKTNETNNNK